ncbi:DNA polymerase IV [Alcaligenaceae bacterium B3P038]|nr:DNA polymerase IV [Alcaligenaceae bacterium B3P038]
MTAATRRIAHLDMDAFYASVELLRYPELKGLPVVIGGRSAKPADREHDGSLFPKLQGYAGRGVVTTSTYEARALGVFSAMGLMKAAQLAPEAILLPADFDSYRHYSRLFKAAVASIAPMIEDRGIDEIYIDLTPEPGETRALAARIKEAVHTATGLTCSIGVAPNKLLAKISSELDKPNGLTVLTHDDIEARIWPLAARKINGIGPKASEKLSLLGIHTVADLARASADLLQANFGRTYAAWLHNASRGIDDREISTHSDPKSISRETTFERDLHTRHDRDVLTVKFAELCAKVADDLRRKGCVGRTIGIKLRYADFRTVTRDVTLPVATADAAVIRRAAAECTRRVPADQRIRLLGVRVGALSGAGATEEDSGPSQGDLFAE